MTDAGFIGCLLVVLVLTGATLTGIHALFGDGGVGFVLGAVFGSIVVTPASGDKQTGRVGKEGEAGHVD
jgi:hypothetical protein